MKNRIILIALLALVYSCTTYTDELKITHQDFNKVTIETIKTDLKVINIVVDQSEFDNMYKKYKEDIEIEAFFNLYKNNELIIDSEEIELQIKGSFSAKFPLKSLGIKFESKYKNEDNDYNLLNPELYSYHSVEKIKSIRLRNSGNDFEQTMIKDMSYTKLAFEAGLDLDLMYAEQSIVFVNNKFLGIMNIRTEKNKHGISKLYDVSKNDVTIAKIEFSNKLIKKDGDFDKIDNFIEAIEQKNYNYLINEIVPTNFIDYFIFETYISNGDWPYNNVMFFAIEDGPFRFFLFDLDGANKSHLDESPLDIIHNDSFDSVMTDLFDVLYANDAFKAQYNARWNELMNSGLLSSGRFNNIVSSYKSNIENEMHMQVDKYETPVTLSNWYINIEELKANFKAREEFVK